MSIATRFSWSVLSDEAFEEIVYAIIASAGPQDIKWRKGPGDKGRDIQATFLRRDALGEPVSEIFYVEAKHHRGGVSAAHIAGALAWAAAELPQVLVLAVSSNITVPCRDNIEAWQRNNPRVRVLVWERAELENRILGHSVPRQLAANLGLVPPPARDLLPADPEVLHKGPTDVGLEMEYRFWITEDEIEKLGLVIDILDRLGEALDSKDHSLQHFELVSLAVPNWSTFLRLVQSQLRLEVAVRDYLVAQVSDASASTRDILASRVRTRVGEVREIGDSSVHVD